MTEQVVGKFRTFKEQAVEDLATIRKSFGFSQEQLAEKMNKDVSTISRWERGKTKEPFLSPVINVANRKYQYVKHMMNPDIAEYVQSNDEMCGLYYGVEYMIMALSKGTLKRYPLLRAAYGFNGASYFKGEGKRLHLENKENLKRALSTPGSHAYCEVPRNSGIVVTEPLTVDFNFVGQQLVYTVSRFMEPEQAAKCNVGIMRYTFG